MMGGQPLGTIDVAGAAPAVLALHGFGATPEEVLLVVEVATELGLRAFAPLLPGHGVSVHDLAQTRWSDWRQCAEQALADLVRRGGPALVVGMSMGSLLALELAADRPKDVLGVGVLGSPLRLPWLIPGLALKLICGLGLPDFNLPKLGGADIRDAVLRRRQVTYESQPAYAGNEIRLAGSRIEARLGEITCPAFVAHGKHDHVCPVSNARRVYAGLGTPAWEKELLILPRSYHIITRDLERGLLRMHLHRFLSRVLQLARRAPESRAQTPVDPYPPPALSVSDRVSASSN